MIFKCNKHSYKNGVLMYKRVEKYNVCKKSWFVFTCRDHRMMANTFHNSLANYLIALYFLWGHCGIVANWHKTAHTSFKILFVIKFIAKRRQKMLRVGSMSKWKCFKLGICTILYLYQSYILIVYRDNFGYKNKYIFNFSY